jgi:hypothetical protein
MAAEEAPIPRDLAAIHAANIGAVAVEAGVNFAVSRTIGPGTERGTEAAGAYGLDGT